MLLEKKHHVRKVNREDVHLSMAHHLMVSCMMSAVRIVILMPLIRPVLYVIEGTVLVIRIKIFKNMSR